ncbi:MAG TPA: M4 family metallopeptidase [Ferruginibacter sp.]|nr:M4 family metallopeptidase [Ferruginibacter sp.]
MCTNERYPFHCIMPPYMSDKLDQVLGIDTETKDKQMRSKRMELATMKPATRSFTLAGAPVNKKLYREVYDAHESPMDIGELIWKEGQKKLPALKDAKNVISAAGHVWNFYKKLFNRNSIDNKGMAILQNIRYREKKIMPYFNAMWDGEQMFYGTGKSKFTNSFTSDLDIIGHELTHGVIDFEAALNYENQSGALNESFSDVFGILIKQWVNKTSARKSDWLIGKNILIGKNALRSMKAPGTAYKNDPIFGDDPQPAVMADFEHMPNTEDDDYGGVHYNSGISNHAFYITAFEINGNAWEKAGAIWYAALQDKQLLKKNANFKAAANATLKKARALFGQGSLAEKAVNKGWKETGVI